jgi:hypothetical protein
VGVLNVPQLNNPPMHFPAIVLVDWRTMYIGANRIRKRNLGFLVSDIDPKA